MRGRSLMFRLCGAGLLVCGLAGAWYGVRVAAAQALYFRCKYGDWRDVPARVVAAAERAHALYPRNYALCIWVAEMAYRARESEAGDERPEFVELAERWCRRGLDLNPWNSQLRMLDVQLTARRSLPEAISKLEAVVDWQYWEPFNQYTLLELYARAGRYTEALATLKVLEPTSYSGPARRILEASWSDEIAAAAAWEGRKVAPSEPSR